jgi:predicted RNA binding protein YcfA (HicA-like mRNA interferase family)
MTKKSKLYSRIKNNPRGITFSELRIFLEDNGFAFKRQSGSHFVYSKKEITFVIPSHNNKVKEIYVKRVIDIIDKMNKD